MRLRNIIVLVAIVIMAVAARAGAEEVEEAGAAMFVDDSSIIKNLVLLCDSGGMRFSLTAGAAQGVRKLELLSGSAVVANKECYGSDMCVMAGFISVGSLSGSVVTAVASDKSGREQRERIRLNIDNSGPKVYMISSMPAMEGFAPTMMAAGETDDKAPSSENVAAKKADSEKPAPVISGELSSAVKGPDMSATIKKNANNDYTISIFARDELGVNFIQILENGSFFDVERCEDKNECLFTKNVKNRKPGRNSYLIKAMNAKGALTFQEEFLSFIGAE